LNVHATTDDKRGDMKDSF